MPSAVAPVGSAPCISAAFCLTQLRRRSLSEGPLGAGPKAHPTLSPHCSQCPSDTSESSLSILQNGQWTRTIVSSPPCLALLAALSALLRLLCACGVSAILSVPLSGDVSPPAGCAGPPFVLIFAPVKDSCMGSVSVPASGPSAGPVPSSASSPSSVSGEAGSPSAGTCGGASSASHSPSVHIRRGPRRRYSMTSMMSSVLSVSVRRCSLRMQVATSCK